MSPHHSDGERVEERWPDHHVVVYRAYDGTLSLTKPESWWTARTFWSSDAPCVLSMEEAQLLADFLGRPCATEPERPTVEALRNRLADYGKEHHAD